MGVFEPTGTQERVLDGRHEVHDIEIVDLDLDGLPDLAAGVGPSGNSNPRGRLMLFNGSGAGLPTIPDRELGELEGALRFTTVVVADLNSDGEPDLASGVAFEFSTVSLEGAFDKLALFFGGK